MEKYDINLGYYYMKLRLQEFYLDKENKQETPFKVEKKVEDSSQKKLENLTNIDKIYFSVNYPGLLIGTGTKIEYTSFNEKEKDNTKNNFKNGLSFDYTTGLPYIPGSGIKGVIRDFFPTEYTKNAGDKDYSEEDKVKTEEQNKVKVELINQILESDYTFEDIERIRDSIFEGRDFEKKENFGKEEYLPIFKRDKFIEGKILIQDKKQILDKDYITPHKKILENPIPIQILKIVPGTEIEILLQLNETKISIPEKDDIVITKEQKINLFTKILFLTGLGAKTNVGYGHFDEEASIKVTRKREEDARKILEKEKLEVLEKEKENMSDFTRFIYEFENEWDDETKKEKFNEIKKFEGEEKKEIAKLYLEYLKKESKPSKKTKSKIKDLNDILNS